jgi:hypothetical protein
MAIGYGGGPSALFCIQGHASRAQVASPVYDGLWTICFGSGFLADGSEVVVREIGAHRHIRIYSGPLPIVLALL